MMNETNESEINLKLGMLNEVFKRENFIRAFERSLLKYKRIGGAMDFL